MGPTWSKMALTKLLLTGATGYVYAIPSRFYPEVDIKPDQAEVLSSTSGIWGHAHVVDLAELSELLVTILKGKTVPTGRQGIYFAETQRHSWKDLAEAIAKAGYLPHGTPGLTRGPIHHTPGRSREIYWRRWTQSRGWPGV